MRIGSLCQGIGGADLALEAHGHTIAWGAEIDPAPAAVCAHHWPDAPNHGDITAIDWSSVEPVDIVSAGFPCPPASTAGKRLGTADERWIWPAVADAIAQLRPRYVFAENVRGLLSAPGHPLRDLDRPSMGGAAGDLVPGHAFGAVLRDLADLGYVSCWGVLSSAAVGGCHRRDRLWIVAADPSRFEVGAEPLAVRRGGDPMVAGQHLEAAAVDLLPTPTARDWEGQNQRRDDSCLPGAVDRIDNTFGHYAPAVTRWAGLFGPPPPTADERRRLNPAFVEWMLGFPAGWVTDLDLTRTAMLTALGNAQQPQTAAAAIAVLGRRVDAELAREAA